MEYFKHRPYDMRSLYQRGFALLSTTVRVPAMTYERLGHDRKIAAEPLEHGPVFIIGHWRSGTTYLQTLLNSDPRILCRGESFDAWQIDDNGRKTTDYEAIVARDADPAAFLDDRLSLTEGPGGPLEAVGIKILFQHNPRLFTEVLPARPEVALIFVHRENKLAQFASMRHTQMTGEWTRTHPGDLPPKLEAHVHWVAESCNELANKDFLLRHWLESLPNPLLCVEYREMFADGFPQALMTHLGLPESTPLHSPLMKQGNNTVVERFAGADTLATSYALGRCLLTIETFDLVLAGRQAIDGDTAQIGPQVAEFLSIPQVTYVPVSYTHLRAHETF